MLSALNYHHSPDFTYAVLLIININILFLTVFSFDRLFNYTKFYINILIIIVQILQVLRVLVLQLLVLILQLLVQKLQLQVQKLQLHEMISVDTCLVHTHSYFGYVMIF